MAPPIYVKGGAWTNAEDQILRAAVSKYGLTQWARVSSLLPKKTAKQAKARWNEYLNPTINRTEWSLQDDEKLLNLAKLLPNQWRSIASVMGRTATHCLERYQKLLSDALQVKDEEEEGAIDTSLTGPGIEALPALGNAFESLPLRPDMEDMDEDEAEMLSEAKARLANTQGKKAKRKERERLLEESRRIALLQKRRELKAAGINISLILKNKKRRKEFDYNGDIPHERKPPPGLYDTTIEDSQNTLDQTSFQKSVKFKGLEDLDKKPKRKAEDDEKSAKRAKKSIADAAGAVSEVAEYQLSKRRGLILPEPGAHDTEEETKKRILQKTQALVSNSTNQEVLEPSKQHTSDSRKKYSSFLKDHLAKISAPKNTNPPLMPPISLKEPVLTDSAVLSSLDIAVDKQTIVVEKGYPIPKPTLLNVSNGESEIEKQINDQFIGLVTSDYIQFVNPIFPGKVIPGISEKSWLAVEKQIEEELKEQKSVKEFDARMSDLPIGEEMYEKVVEQLVQLDSKATAAENAVQFGKESEIPDSESIAADLHANFLEFAGLCADEQLHKQILQDENVAVSVRSARLHELVDDIRAAERRAQLGI